MGEEASEDVFSLLSDETRLTILRELADAASGSLLPRSDAVAYSTLMDRVGLRDSGNFNYHLDALRGRFVEKVEDGYRIRRAGLEIVRTLRAGNLADIDSVEPSTVGEECPYCEAAIEVTIEDGWLYIACTNCQGFYGGMASLPDGLFGVYEVSPATRHDRRVEEVFRVVLLTSQHHAQFGFEGICPECTGPIDASFVICSAHDTTTDRVCEACGRPTPVLAHGECSVCGLDERAPPAYTVWNHSPTRQRLRDAGVTVGGSLWQQSISPLTWECTIDDCEETAVNYQIPVGEGADLEVRVTESFDVRVVD